MTEISIGAVGAALIAGLVSLLGLVIGKEQKVSEFRQAWIDELRRDIISYLVSINAISDALRLGKTRSAADDQSLISNYKLLNSASHGITLRVNADEEPAKNLLNSMAEFEDLASDNSNLTPTNIKLVEGKFIMYSKLLLKFEWNRVKKGESTFVITKRILYGIIAAAFIFLGSALFFNKEQPKVDAGGRYFHFVRTATDS